MTDTQSNYLTSSLLGIARGLCVHSLIYPMEVIKVQQQQHFNQEKSYQVFFRLFKEGGFASFYRGILPQLMKTSIKQAWCWPIIVELPAYLRQYNVKPFTQQAATGLAIASIDAIISTPLERAKMLSIVAAKSSFSLRKIYKNGWFGLVTHWAKLTIAWSTFLVSQKYLREKYSNQKLTLYQSIIVGIKVAAVVSIASAPFDVANTLKQSQNKNLTFLFSGHPLRNMYRGWPLNALSLIIHNTASIVVINQLD